MTPQDLVEQSLTQAAAAVATGQMTATQLVEASLGQIEATDDQVGAFASVQAEAAMQRAIELDAGEVTGPLHGVPIALKDLIFTRGVATEANCGALDGFTPDHDATVVQRLTEAGAIVIGKTNTHELAFGVSCPDSRNPWDPTRMTGGSSGGSAAAVASRQVFGALGTDTGGSVRIPSSYCGTTAIKTTRGLVPRDGIHLISWTYDTVGPMARTADDCQLLLEVLAGPSDADPYSTSTPLEAVIDPGRLRLGVPTDAWLANAPMDPEVLGCLRSAIEVVSGVVASAENLQLPAWEDHGASGSTIVFSEAAAMNAELIARSRHRLGEEVTGILEAGAQFSAVALASAENIRRHHEANWHRVFDDVDLVICPVTPNHVLDHGLNELHGMPLIPATTQFTFAVNGAGLPAISLPGGQGSDGLPIGFQLIGKPLSERTLSAVGRAVQAITNHHTIAPHTTRTALATTARNTS